MLIYCNNSFQVYFVDVAEIEMNILKLKLILVETSNYVFVNKLYLNTRCVGEQKPNTFNHNNGITHENSRTISMSSFGVENIFIHVA